MSPRGHPDAEAVFDDLDSVLARARALPVEAMTVSQQLAMLQRCEQARRQLPAIEHPVINNLACQATPQRVGRHAGACDRRGHV